MTEEVHPEGKILIVGGGIANFTNVAATFKVFRDFSGYFDLGPGSMKLGKSTIF